VTCHSAEHPCGASVLRGLLASPSPAEIEELKSAREGEAGHRAALDCEDATTAGDDSEPVAGSQHRREPAPAALLRVQDLDLSDRAVALGVSCSPPTATMRPPTTAAWKPLRGTWTGRSLFQRRVSGS
jgi:hypothetical protein